MKMLVRIAVGIIGLVVLVFGIKQMITGMGEMSGKSRTSQPQKIGETFTSTENGYSHRIPQGWENKPAPPPTAGMIVAPKSSGLASNMVTTVENYNGTLRAYVDANIQALKTNAPDAKVVGDSEFATDGKTPAYKLKLQNKVKNVDLAQFMYLFEGAAGQKIIVSCTATTKDGPVLEPLFDDCMKSFALSRR